MGVGAPVAARGAVVFIETTLRNLSRPQSAVPDRQRQHGGQVEIDHLAGRQHGNWRTQTQAVAQTNASPPSFCVTTTLFTPSSKPIKVRVIALPLIVHRQADDLVCDHGALQRPDQAFTSLNALSWPEPVGEVLDAVFSQVPLGTSVQALPW